MRITELFVNLSFLFHFFIPTIINIFPITYGITY